MHRFRQAHRKHGVLHLKDGISLDGVLVDLYADGVELDAAKYIRADDYDTPLDGIQLVPWGQIIWVQELTDSSVVARAENT